MTWALAEKLFTSEETRPPHAALHVPIMQDAETALFKQVRGDVGWWGEVWQKSELASGFKNKEILYCEVFAALMFFSDPKKNNQNFKRVGWWGEVRQLLVSKLASG